MSSHATEAPRNESLVRRVVGASTIGTIMEWYDFYLYGFSAALIFNVLFFPQFDPLAGTLAAFGSYALGFFARPIGGLVFGHVGDRIGRRAMLVTTMTIMGVATLLMGLLPTYSQIGIWAAVLLTVLRVVQGFAAGAEFGGAVVLAGEYAPRRRRALYMSLPSAGIFVAIICSVGVLQLLSAVMSESTFLAWGWRVPFLLSIVLVGVGLYLRLRISESPEFVELQRKKELARRPVVEVLRTYPRELLLAMGTRFAETGGGYIVITFVLTYLAQQVQVGTGIGQAGLLIASAVALVMVPVYGFISGRVGRKPVYLLGAAGLGAFIVPYFALLNTGSTALIWIAMIVSLGVFYAAMGGSQPAMYAEIFDARVRVTGLVAIREISAPIAGGIAPFVATALLIAADGASWPIAVYVIAMCIVSTICVLPIRLRSGFIDEYEAKPRQQKVVTQ
ncbi:MAG: MFS transporter [Streptosporangiales bacterium]|nr:MFS transporter [Streptosporangiales bacterium]